MTHPRRPRDEHTAAAVAELADVDHWLTTVIDRARIIIAGGLPRGPNSDEDHMAISDAHLGLKAATGRAFLGASRQRYRRVTTLDGRREIPTDEATFSRPPQHTFA